VMIMIMNVDFSTISGSKKHQYVTFNSMLNPMNVGQMADMSYAFESIIDPNRYKGLAIGISFPVPASEFPKKGDIQAFLGVDPQTASSYDALKEMLDKKGPGRKYFDRLVILERALRGELPFDEGIPDILGKTALDRTQLRFDQVFIMPKYAHNIFPHMHDAVHLRDLHGYFEPPDKKSIRSQVIYIGDERGSIRLAEKEARKRNIDVIGLYDNNFHPDVAANRKRRLMTEETERDVVREIEGQRYSLCLLPPEPLDRSQKDSISSVYEKCVKTGEGEMVVAVSYLRPPMDVNENREFWKRVRDGGYSPFEKMEGTRTFVYDYIGRARPQDLRKIHITACETDEFGKITLDGANRSYLPVIFEAHLPEGVKRRRKIFSFSKNPLKELAKSYLFI
jgi:hypothetical protein